MESTQFVPFVNYSGEFSKANLPRSLCLYLNPHFERIPYCILRLQEATLQPLRNLSQKPCGAHLYPV